MNIEQVRSLAAVVDEGTVEGGAFVLGITPSAMSQRIRTLESRLGQVLIRRANPVTVTEAGEAVLKYAREIELLESETMDRLHSLTVGADSASSAEDPSKPAPTILRIGVNADSMSTWFRPVFAEVADWDDIVIRIEVVDQDKALPLLTSGEVLGTVTSESRSGYGTRAEKLGTMRYVAVATTGLVERFGARPAPSGPRRHLGAEVDLGSMPMVKFGRDDDLQLDFLARAGVAATPPVSVVPSS
ncbi:ArgP/LysG family DNA-binding transcriptional regulator [Brevibacterium sp.]|uniref:ArgP/LysG family DNA-binding transcriptional regulator n=1 Tax=Brevibacterium sp. TaxID=1701 RepID=UPI002811DFDE|nr:ArgP/LysG family DNA-binding transcriptional regulator [Brevibacterium sp.]